MPNFAFLGKIANNGTEILTDFENRRFSIWKIMKMSGANFQISILKIPIFEIRLFYCWIWLLNVTSDFLLFRKLFGLFGQFLANLEI